MTVIAAQTGSRARSATTDKGFTLVELLVVIGIIAVLISILLPAMRKARESSQRAACLSTVRQMQLGSAMYANDNSMWFVPVFTWFATGETWAENETTRRALGILPHKPVWYAQANTKMICPGAAYARANPNVDGTFNIRASYGMNYSNFMDWQVPSLYVYGATPPKWLAHKATKINRSNMKLAIADAISPAIRVSNSGYYVGEKYPTPNDQIAYRHQGGVNIAFYDGHAEWMHRKQVDKTYLDQGQIDTLWYPYKP